MELRHLRYFIAVAEELNFRKAAERLRVTRPALSKQIKDLEQETGLQLLQRDTVRVSLTDAGTVFLGGARRALASLEKTIDLARHTQNGHLGELRIGSAGQIASGFLPEALQIFSEQFPQVPVQLFEMSPGEQMQALRKGQIHLAFAYSREASHQSDLQRLLLFRSHFAIAISRSHRLALGPALTLSDLHQIPLLCLSDEGPSTHEDQCRRIFDHFDLHPGPVRQVRGFDSLLTLLAASQGCTLLPDALDLRQSHGILHFPILPSSEKIEFTMWAVWERRATSRHLDPFVAILRRLQSRKRLEPEPL